MIGDSGEGDTDLLDNLIMTAIDKTYARAQMRVDKLGRLNGRGVLLMGDFKGLRKSSQQTAANSDLLRILVHLQATIAGLQDFTLLYQSLLHACRSNAQIS
jgi:hypothetical protein